MRSRLSSKALGRRSQTRSRHRRIQTSSPVLTSSCSQAADGPLTLSSRVRWIIIRITMHCCSSLHLALRRSIVRRRTQEALRVWTSADSSLDTTQWSSSEAISHVAVTDLGRMRRLRTRCNRLDRTTRIASTRAMQWSSAVALSTVLGVECKRLDRCTKLHSAAWLRSRRSRLTR